jgi:PAS domain S-box-containing protein
VQATHPAPRLPLARHLNRLVWAAVLPLLALGVAYALDRIAQDRLALQQIAERRLLGAVAAVDAHLGPRLRALALLADSPLADDPARWDELRSVALQFQTIHGDPIVFADARRRVHFKTADLPGVNAEWAPAAGRDAAAEALATGRPAVGDAVRRSADDQTAFAIAVPGLRAGQVRHLLLTLVATRELAGALAAVAPPEAWALTVTDSAGRIVVRIAPPGLDPARDVDPRWRFEARSAYAPWAITVEVPRGVPRAQVLRTAAWVSALLLLVTLVGVVGGRRFARRIERQAAALADASAAASSGADFDIAELAAARERIDEALEQLRRSDASHRELFAANPQPMWVYDLDTLAFLAVNDAAVRHYGWRRDEFLAMTIKDIRPPEDLPRLFNNVERVTDGLDDAGLWRHRTRDGRLIDVHIRSHTLVFQGRRAELVLALDVTERLRAEAALRTSELRYRLAAAGGHVWDIDLVHGSTMTPAAFWQRLGRDAPAPGDEVAGLQRLLHPDDAPRLRAALRAHLEQRAPYRLEFRARHAAGHWCWFQTQGQAVWDERGRAVYMAGTTFDITAQRRAEQALLDSQRELSELAQRLLVQERETTQRLAQALHDRLGQLLGSCRLHLDMAAGPAPAGEAPLARASALLDQAVAEVRRLLVDLRPSLLDTQGLVASLDNELRSAGAGLPVRTRLHADAVARAAHWPAGVEYAAFMIAREALANALRHAGAGRIEIEVDGDGRRLRLTVRDDGRGIAAAQLDSRPGHLGLVGMRERALAIGAHLEIGPAQPRGTRVSLTWEASTA